MTILPLLTNRCSADAPVAAGTVFAGAATGVAADLFAVVKPPPVAHFAIERHQRDFAHLRRTIF